MKKLNNNKKGFTLIELLAVIVILAILVMVAIPAVTRYLETSRQSTYIDTARAAVDAVRQDYVMNGGSKSRDLEAVNTLLEKKLVQSPYGDKYTSACVKINDSNAGSNVQKTSPVTYSICLTDGSKGVDGDENELTVKAVKTCTCQQ